jgi:hypothetical protein
MGLTTKSKVEKIGIEGLINVVDYDGVIGGLILGF